MPSTLSYTEEQARAIATRGVSVALDAGAGCGKTFVLTERFLSHLTPEGQDAPLELHELVAITFTDAAAREMRQRVRSKCLDRLRDSPPEHAGYWLRLLRLLDAARVSTIHAFCSTLVRTHALELGLDPSFHVLDQAAADVLLSESTDQRLRAALQDRDPDVMGLAAEWGVAGLKTRLAPLREAATVEALSQWAKRPAEKTVAVWKAYYEQHVAPGERSRLGDLPELDVVRSLIPECIGDAATRGKLSELDTLLDLIQRGEASPADLLAARELAKLQGVCNKKGDWPDADAKKQYGAACTKLRAAIDKIKPWRDDPVQAKAAEMGQRLARVARAVEHAYSAAKASAAALDFNDLLALARRLLTDPDLRDAQRRIRGSLKLLLVDEFQDTDQLQVDIVTSLVGEGLTDGALFFVGDFKQSIYRFRGAEPQVFRSLQDRTPQAGRLPLSQNFRSQPAVLGFVNALFGPLFGQAYTPLRAARPQVGPTPAVQFLWEAAPEDSNAETARRAEARRLAQHVGQLLEDPTERIAEQHDGQWIARRVRPGDIAILFRALSDVQYYEEALRDAGVDHHLIGGHAFYSQQEVYDLLNLLRSVTSGCDEVSLAGVLRSPFFSLHDQTLLWLVRSGGSLNAGLMRRPPTQQLDADQQERVNHARGVLQKLRAMRGVGTTAQLIRAALDLTGYDATLLSEFLGERKLGNLEKIIEQARVADQTRPGDIDAFVRQLTEFIARQPKEALAATTGGEDDVVRLMTIHHAKGLEFPVVFVADLERKANADSATAAFDPDLGPLVKPTGADKQAMVGLDLYKRVKAQAEREEQVRLFYVACTRAADLLVLSACVEDLEKPKGDWLKTLAQVFNVQTGVPLVDEEGGPLVEVVPNERQRKRETKQATRRPDLPALLDEAERAARSAAPEQGVLPIAIDPRDLRRFSVSRLSGRLHYRSDFRRETDVSAESEDPIDPRGLGTLVHAVMERVDFASPRDVPDWCEALAPLHLRRNYQAAAQLAQELIEQFLSSDRSRALAASPHVERETEFLLAWPLGTSKPTAQLQGYIDCLYQDSNGNWRLLDYKTNRATAKQVPQAAEAYRLQMAVYALAVEQSLGVRPVSLDVHFLRPGVEATFAWDDPAREAAVKLIDQAIAETREAAAQPAQ